MDFDIIWNVFDFYFQDSHFWFPCHKLVPSFRELPTFIYKWLVISLISLPYIYGVYNIIYRYKDHRGKVRIPVVDPKYRTWMNRWVGSLKCGMAIRAPPLGLIGTPTLTLAIIHNGNFFVAVDRKKAGVAHRRVQWLVTEGWKYNIHGIT